MATAEGEAVIGGEGLVVAVMRTMVLAEPFFLTSGHL
jgi:hypothetical protein